MALTTGQESRSGRAATPDGGRSAAARRRFPEPAYLHIANNVAERIGQAIIGPATSCLPRPNCAASSGSAP